MKQKTALITGANRGIGLEFVKQLREKNYEVFASCRFPEKANKLSSFLPEDNILHLDVSDLESISNAFETVKNQTDSIQLIINNAGVPGNRGELQNISFEDCVDSFSINALGPLFLTKTFLPLMQNGTKIVNISSLMGSIKDNRSGGYYSYRISKAAVNMVTKNLHNDLSKKGIIVVCMHPGWVRTRMGSPIAPISSKKSVVGMLQVLGDLNISDSGGFFNYKGEMLPW